MNFAPILSAPFEIQIHVAAAVLALVLGPVALYRQKRDRLHKVMGYVWVVAMLIVAVSALFIEAVVMPVVGPYGPIHLFAFWTFTSLWQAMAAIFRRDVRRHQTIMRALYWQALGLTALLSMLPGRRINEMVFGDASLAGLWVIAGLGALAAAVVVGRRWKGRGRVATAK